MSVTNELTRAGYAARFPESADRIRVIPPLLTLPPASPPAAVDGPARLVFLGTLYPTIRRPDYLLAVFRSMLERPGLADAELHFYGDVRECAASFDHHADLLGTQILVHGPVPRAEAAVAMASATALVNIGNDTAYQLPSKLVEYAMTGKPILNLASVADDSSSRFLESYLLHVTLHAAGPPTTEDVDRAARLLLEGGAVPADALSRWIAPYTLAEVSCAYLALLGEPAA